MPVLWGLNALTNREWLFIEHLQCPRNKVTSLFYFHLSSQHPLHSESEPYLTDVGQLQLRSRELTEVIRLESGRGTDSHMSLLPKPHALFTSHPKRPKHEYWDAFIRSPRNRYFSLIATGWEIEQGVRHSAGKAKSRPVGPKMASKVVHGSCGQGRAVHTPGQESLL